jgi:hypothetical protein
MLLQNDVKASSKLLDGAPELQPAASGDEQLDGGEEVLVLEHEHVEQTHGQSRLRQALPEAPGRVLRRGVAALPSRPPHPALPRLRADAALPLRLLGLPVLLGGESVGSGARGPSPPPA